MNDKKKVLIIDDQNVARGFFEMYVKMSDGYELSGSLSVAEHALSYCAVHPVDLIIMDVMMKYGLDGLTVAKRIKEKYPEIKVILT
ncbi:MAG: response regulator transcription factor, partial [Lachnospiraceae bacterium]|nr:response regulator transcription factor [Lachnospiraceae bacterium]